jgi:putative RNA 2'-phosphotransferase
MLVSLRRELPEWCDLCESDLLEMVESSSKRRHEMKDGQIRALYGHSLPNQFQRTAATPPDLLFHGTSPSFLVDIESSGLLPMGRQYVHLSTDDVTALAVGMRKSRTPAILRILARQAHEQGLRFYQGNEKVWLADKVPVEFINLLEQ